jgi:hypothetical protein
MQIDSHQFFYCALGKEPHINKIVNYCLRVNCPHMKSKTRKRRSHGKRRDMHGSPSMQNSRRRVESKAL